MNKKNYQSKICSKQYIYIPITVSLFIAKNIVLTLKELSFDTDKNIFGIELVIKNHIFMKLLLQFFGYIIIGGILYFHSLKKKDTKDTKDENSNLIVNNQESILLSNASAPKILLISGIFYSIQLIARNIVYFLNTWKLDMWIFNIFFIYIFMKCILNTPIYKHQLFILFFISLLNIILIIFSSALKYNGQSFYDSIIIKYGSVFPIILFYIIYLALSALICSSQVFQKKLMDIYYVSIYKILFTLGLISSSIILLALIITTNVSCAEYLKGEICLVSYKDYKDGHYFLDNFYIYLYNMADKYNSNKLSFFLEIFLAYPLHSFLNFMKYLYETSIILNLDPNYVVLSDIFYYTIKIIIILIYNPKDITNYLTLIGEFVALYGYLFYLEILEIKICGCNKNTKNQIYRRSIFEILDNEKNSDEEEEVEKEEEKKEESIDNDKSNIDDEEALDDEKNELTNNNS